MNPICCGRGILILAFDHERGFGDQRFKRTFCLLVVGAECFIREDDDRVEQVGIESAGEMVST